MRGLSRKKSFDRTVVKKCQKCEQQVPVACKYCSCGHQFWSKKFPTLIPSASVDDDSSLVKVRRTERTRRDSQRPDYFNSIVVETQSKRGRKRSQSLVSHQTSCEGNLPGESPTTTESPMKRKRGRPKGTPNKPLFQDLELNDKLSLPPPTPPVIEEDIHLDLPPERVKQFQYILMDINCKYSTQNFKPS